MKHILAVRKTTCNDVVYGELGKYPVIVHIKSRILNYWGRIITGKNDKLCFVMYQCLLKLYNENKFKSQWIDYIKKTLNNSGMSGIWLHQEALNFNWFKSAFERNVKDQFISEWFINLRNKSSCDTYIS